MLAQGPARLGCLVCRLASGLPTLASKTPLTALALVKPIRDDMVFGTAQGAARDGAALCPLLGVLLAEPYTWYICLHLCMRAMNV